MASDSSDRGGKIKSDSREITPRFRYPPFAR
jgi:hypothetical protein